MSALTPQEQKECVKLLKNSVLLSACKDEELLDLAQSATKRKYKRGDVLLREGDPQLRMFLISSGEISREKLVDGKIHNIETQMGGFTVGSLHIMNQDPCYATTRAQSEVTTYELDSEHINQVFRSNPSFAWNVANSLMLEVRRHTRTLRTPLFEQRQTKTPFLAVSIAASVESFYRAALNSILNQQLTGKKMGSLFPNMHIQIPTRIMYVNGFKGIRQYLDNTVDPNQFSSPNVIRLLAAITPGIIMTPISSILEASNAGHSNPEPMYKRWMRGIVPRAGREVIFGVGLNQLSDYMEERVPNVITSEPLRNAAGSLAAGVVCGYLSHVVHNLSTLKLMTPSKSYSVLFKEYVKKAESRLPANLSPGLRTFAAYSTAIVFPVGLHIRTSQIVGSFIILNGTINALHGLELKFDSKK